MTVGISNVHSAPGDRDGKMGYTDFNTDKYPALLPHFQAILKLEITQKYRLRFSTPEEQESARYQLYNWMRLNKIKDNYTVKRDGLELVVVCRGLTASDRVVGVVENPPLPPALDPFIQRMLEIPQEDVADYLQKLEAAGAVTSVEAGLLLNEYGRIMGI